MKRLVRYGALGLALAAAFWGGTAWRAQEEPEGDQAETGRAVLYYVDPMNPAHTSPEPGTAPCGMPMEPVYADGAATRALPPGVARVTAERRQQLGVRVEPAQVSARQHALRTLGRVAADENRTHRLTAGSEGWVWKVLGSTTGSVVRKDQLMATVYNYQFLTRQQQYLYALEFEERREKQAAQDAARAAAKTPPPPRTQTWGGEQSGEAPGEPAPEVPSASMVPATPGGINPVAGAVFTIRDQLEVARLELFSLGVGEYQLREIARNRRVVEDIEVRSPVDGLVLRRNVSAQQRFEKGEELFRVADLSRVWILADVFEREARYIEPGTKARVSLPHQRQTFEATVTEVPPPYDPATRTLKVRLVADNPGLVLRPEMFVDVEFLLDFPPALHVPADAVLDSGLRQTVFVDLGDGYFEPREVEAGSRFGQQVEIVAGLMPGERIAVSGNFLLNSESRMKLAAAGWGPPPERDPVCGMAVDAAAAEAAGLTAEEGGETAHFCSPPCRDAFVRAQEPGGGAAVAARPPPPGRPGQKERSAGIGGKDVICGMPVDEQAAAAAGLTSRYRDRAYSFCSPTCKDAFDAAVRRRAELAGTAAEAGVDAPRE